MDQQQREAYEESLYAPAQDEDHMPTVPAWATALGFCMDGCYLYLPVDSLVRDCASLKRVKESCSYAYMQITRTPTCLRDFESFFRQLELMDVNLIQRGFPCTLKCYGASLVTSKTGKAMLNGRFQLTYMVDENAPDVVINMRGSLVISLAPGTFETLSTSGLVPFFETECKVTMDPSDFSEHWIAFAKSDNPLFGSFSVTNQRATHAPPVSSSKPFPSLSRLWERRLSLQKS